MANKRVREIRIGVLTDIKINEYGVGLVPSSVREMTAKGHKVFVESEALKHATLPYALALADRGIAALDADTHLAASLNIHLGNSVYPAVIEDLHYLTVAE